MTKFPYPKSVIGGLACRLPMSKNSEEFWDNLISGKDMIGATHWPPGLYGLPPRIGALQELEAFDNDYFEISIEKADNMNPMLRHLLEVTYECIVDSGLSLEALQNVKTGIYLACFGSDTDNTETSRDARHYATTSPYLVAGLAKTFGLTGPAVTIDTACSSSLATFNTAVNDLKSGKCTYAIVTGCNLVINPLFSQQMFVLGMLSKDGKSSVFDEGANGYVRAEGCAALLLASDADCFPRVYCNVVDVGINCDGYKKAGITNPNPETQAALIKELYTRSEVNVNDVYYVELHGTGTQVGDTAETSAIAQVFGEHRDGPLHIGSVKSNMGHSEATSALASMIKVILMMQHGEIPGNLNYKNPNPNIEGIHSNKLTVVDKPIPLKGKYVGVSSFGFGGVNGHVILEAYQEENEDDFVDIPRHVVVPITTRNAESVENLVEFISNNRYNSVLLGMLSLSLLSCDEKQPIRGYVHTGPGEDDFYVHCDTNEVHDIPSIVLCLEDFMFSYIAVHKDLLEIENFMLSLKACSQSIRRMDHTLDIVPMLETGEVVMPHTRCGMLIATAILISMHVLFEDVMATDNVIIGLGLTEVVGAYLDGCLTLDQCFNVINCIGKHVEKFSKNNEDKWLINQVHLDIDALYQLGPGTQVLSIDTPDMATVSIETKYKEKVLEKIHSAGGYYNLLVSNVPLYSILMRQTSERIKRDLRDIIPSPLYRSQGLISAQSGWRCTIEEDKRCVLFDADYVSKLICKPINLASLLVHKPKDSLYIHIVPTKLPPPHLRHVPTHLDSTYMFSDHSCLSENNTKFSISKLGSRGKSFSTQSDDDTELEQSYSLEKEREDIPFVATAESLCHTVGLLHMQGFQLNVEFLFPKPKGPLGITCPSLSPLVCWDHSARWYIPNWMEFSCRKRDDILPYEITMVDDKTILTPEALLLYNAWQVIVEDAADQSEERDSRTLAIKMTNLHFQNQCLLTCDKVNGAIVRVLSLTRQFAVVSKGKVLLQGDFEVKDSTSLPSVPGYDLDINDNNQMSPTDSDQLCEKTEVEWEDCWLDFINDVLEFSYQQFTEFPLAEMIVDPQSHLKEAKTCPRFLAIAEKYTRICRSGGLALIHRFPQEYDIPDISKQVTGGIPPQTLATRTKHESLGDTSGVPEDSQDSQGHLNTGMMQTPLPAASDRIDLSNFSPEVHLVHVQDTGSSDRSNKVDTKLEFQKTSTPVAQATSVGGNQSALPTPAFVITTCDEPTTDEGATESHKVEPTSCEGATTSYKVEPTKTPIATRVISVPKISIDVMEDEATDKETTRPPADDVDGPKGLTERQGTPNVKVMTPMGSFRQLMKDKSRIPPPKLNLLKPKLDIIISSPFTPMTPALKDILTPKCVSNLVPLNPIKVGKENPLFIVHPVTGMITLLEPLGKALKVPCFGIQRTPYMPTDSSIGGVANFYVNAIQMVQPTGPYRISGYSFGSMIALEMAKQLQAREQKVDKLIFLDGSPLYIQSQIGHAMKRLPQHASKREAEEMLEAGALLNWMSFYGAVEDRELKFGLLRKLPSLEDRLNTAVAMTFKEVKVSKSPLLTKWFKAAEKIMKQNQKKNYFADAAKELIRFKRRDNAATFVTHTKMASSYMATDKFVGDVYLHRIKAEPMFESLKLPTDYGLQALCTGKVHLKFYDGNHESFITKDSLVPLAKDMGAVLHAKQ